MRRTPLVEVGHSIEDLGTFRCHSSNFKLGFRLFRLMLGGMTPFSRINTLFITPARPATASKWPTFRGECQLQVPSRACLRVVYSLSPLYCLLGIRTLWTRQRPFQTRSFPGCWMGCHGARPCGTSGVQWRVGGESSPEDCQIARNKGLECAYIGLDRSHNKLFSISAVSCDGHGQGCRFFQVTSLGSGSLGDDMS